MKIIFEMDLHQFPAWSEAVNTRAVVLLAGKADAFENYIEKLYPDGITETQLNDLLWFDKKNIFEYLGIDEKKEED